MEPNPSSSLPPGTTYLGGGRCYFSVWAPRVKSLAVHILGARERLVPLPKGRRDYFCGTVEGVEPGSLYYYLLDGEIERPDPASRHQPEGVHGPSQVVDLKSFAWSDHCWFGPARENLVFYELHVGTFTREGTFEAIIPHLEELKELGITAIQLMPVAQFPGSRNWGYDGVYPFAVQNSYGGPNGLQRLVDACHQKGLAVFLDVVYNHLGPEGNYLGDYAPYFTERYRTPWGPAVNFDGPGSDEVRRYFIENALYWVRDFHLDGLRLDAVHAIMDMSATHFLEELAEEVHREAERLGRRVYVVAESDLNDARLIRPRTVGGYGLDAQWCDDFHHALHALLTGERLGYYRDFGELFHLTKAFRKGYVYTGQYSEYRQRRHGGPTDLCQPYRFVVFTQNHDQVGNRAGGERLSNLASFEDLKLAAAVAILSPYIPLLFMGEEYGETAPFLYFTSHTDPKLAEAVRKGRQEEFSAFAWQEVPDPQDEQTFLRSRLNRNLRRQGHHQVLYGFYRELLRLRRQVPALQSPKRENMEVNSYPQELVLVVQRWNNGAKACIICSFKDIPVFLNLPLEPGRWQKLLDTAEERWLGKGSTVPPVLSSLGRIELALPPKTCILLEHLE